MPVNGADVHESQKKDKKGRISFHTTHIKPLLNANIPMFILL